ncbi:hypothetical protein PPL19_05390 [Pseudomonas psychrotolerans L19]|uniref:hypothetical protein n=1 Tax=Pseudomonas oryzihabitans TaxID=47885 RepID=UPI00023A2A7F|nr:hypothetical protein [Pseudomonas psychrotolerans]EHK72347.1 hypothetical protein PPL19_05390 [Pseudomonas psychrotolerans L19]
MSREVTERDFRLPEFRDADPKDYEIRDDGKVVRKDRWETGIRSIAYHLRMSSRGGFEIDDVVAKVQQIAGHWHDADPEDFPGPGVERIDVRLSDGSVLVDLGRDPLEPAYLWLFRDVRVVADWFGADVIEWRVTPKEHA